MSTLTRSNILLANSTTRDDNTQNRERRLFDGLSSTASFGQRRGTITHGARAHASTHATASRRRGVAPLGGASNVSATTSAPPARDSQRSPSCSSTRTALDNEHASPRSVRGDFHTASSNAYFRPLAAANRRAVSSWLGVAQRHALAALTDSVEVIAASFRGGSDLRLARHSGAASNFRARSFPSKCEKFSVSVVPPFVCRAFAVVLSLSTLTRSNFLLANSTTRDDNPQDRVRRLLDGISSTASFGQRRGACVDHTRRARTRLRTRLHRGVAASRRSEAPQMS